MKITRRCTCGVRNLEQFLLCTSFDYLNCIIWKSILHESCRGFHTLSNNLNYSSIGLTYWYLQLFFRTAIFLLTRILILDVLAYARVSLRCQNAFMQASLSRRWCKLPFCVASISLLKEGSQVKDLQDEVSYMLVLHFEESDISLWLGFLLSLILSILSCHLVKLQVKNAMNDWILMHTCWK